MEKEIELDFSINGEGRILMTAIGNTLYLEKIKNKDLKIGDVLALNDNNYEKRIKLNFYKTKSIDILIEKLIAIKNNLIINSAS